MKMVKAKKSLGQNFLKDENVLKKIANVYETSLNDLIIEIGPGMGALTKYLVEKDSHVVALEIDLRMKEYLDRLNNLDVYYQDFLKTDFSFLNKYSYDKLYVIANIPYYITTPIIEHFIKNNVVPDGMVLLVQKEVGLRFTSTVNSREYGYMSVYLQHYFDVQKLFTVSSKCFVPEPKVDSMVVKFTKKNKIVKINEEKFFNLVKKAFMHKRKTLKNNLDVSLEEFYKINGYDNNIRAENLSYEEFILLYNYIYKE